MLSARLLQLARGPTVKRDDRSVLEVFDAVAARTGKPHEPVVVATLREQGVDHAWQLEQLSDADWDRLGPSLGLKTAAKAELANPTLAPTFTPASMETESAILDERTRQFLMLPAPDGTHAKPLCQVSALFLGLLTTPVADRQSLMLALCELMALVSGLFLPVPFEFRRWSDPHELDLTAAAKGWDVPPTLADGMDAMVLFIFLSDTVIVIWSVCMALMIAAGGWHADDRFCQALMAILASLFTVFSFNVFLLIIILAIWQLASDTASPYPLLGGVVIYWLGFQALANTACKFFAEHMPLEIYHQPQWCKANVRMNFPWLKDMYSDAALRPRAEKRAVKLRKQMGFAPAATGTGEGDHALCIAASPMST